MLLFPSRHTVLYDSENSLFSFLILYYPTTTFFAYKSVATLCTYTTIYESIKHI